jgi:hypothetical protein
MGISPGNTLPGDSEEMKRFKAYIEAAKAR